MATLIFVLFWVLLGTAIVFIGINGGVRGARERLLSPSRPANRAATAAIALIIVGIGIVVPILLITGNDRNASKQALGVRLASDDRHGREIFSRQCGVCHTLRAARTVGKVGPNLDQLKPPKALVLDALAHGRQRGNGTMPADLVTGSDARAVADFVSKVAGH